MSERTAENLIEGIVTIPTIPTVLSKLNGLILNPDSSAGDISEVVSTDQSIAIKVLRIANSCFYALRSPVSILQIAVTILGTRVLRNMVMQATTIQAYKHLQGTREFDLEAFWQHSVSTAICAQVLAKHSPKIDGKPEEYYSSGLIHDVGKVILLDSRPEQFLEAVQKTKDFDGDSTAAEREVFGFDHAQVGELLATRWKLSPEIAAGIGLHHTVPTSEAEAHFVGCLVYVADKLAHNLEDHEGTDAANELDAEAFEILGLSGERIIKVVEEIAALSVNLEV